jgi:radical SAM superfamily enzyme YgiQ (UPF0313 family)
MVAVPTLAEEDAKRPSRERETLVGGAAEVGGPRGAELEAIYQSGFVGTVLFVDDNLVANQKAVREMLEEIVVWQKARGYPYPLTGEASINLARNHEVLRLMQEARFTHMFVGVESPDPATLQRISKRQNTMDPLVQSLRVLESYGLEPILGMIMGFDCGGPDSGRALAPVHRRDARAHRVLQPARRAA